MTVKVSDDDFVQAFRSLGSPAAVARFLELSIRAVYRRRNNLAAKGIDLVSRPVNETRRYERTQTFLKRRDLALPAGQVIVYSDAHFWPGPPPLAYLALLEVIRAVKPKAIIANGDLMDCSRISRHEPRGWLHQPTVREELGVMVERQDEIRKLAGPRCALYRTLGNHDIRFERYIAIRAPELENVKGTSLEDFIPDWPCSWSVAINDNTLVKHRWKGGIHATYRNTVESGWNMVTGHLHRMRASPFTDLRDDVRFGVDTGCLADPDQDAFDYTEDNPTDWRSGFAVLTYQGGAMLWPEFCYVMRGKAYFRGEAIA